ncbi:MAG TPA: hypothetical protein VIZ65_02440 [Cellvibrionaceae bacterium]
MKYSWIIGAAISVAPFIFSNAAQADDAKGLTVIVNFGVQPGSTPTSPCSSLPTAFTESQQKNLYKLINEVNHSASGNVGSLRDYYFDMSRGSLNLTSDVVVVSLDNNRNNERCNFEFAKDPNTNNYTNNIRTDEFGSVTSFRGATTISLTGGPMAEIIDRALCKLGEKSLNPNCTSASYSKLEFDGAGVLQVKPYSTPYDFTGLSQGEVLYNGDWLDRIHIDGLGQSAAVAGQYPTNPYVLQTYKFVQFIVPTSGNSDVDWGGAPGKSLWPRSLPYLKANQNIAALNSLPNAEKGLNGIPIGRTQLIPVSVTAPYLGLIAHESGHTLFGFKDYYDTQQLPYKTSINSQACTTIDLTNFMRCPQSSQSKIGNSSGDTPFTDIQWYESIGVADLSLMGKNGSTNPPLVDAPHREKAGWEIPADLSQALENTEYTLDWRADGSIPSTARSFKYCKPNSNLNECFYLEGRVSGSYRDAGSLRSMYSKITAQDGTAGIDVSGMLIWHAEHYLNAFDFSINQRKEQSPGLHFDVSVVEADGKYDFLQKRGTALNLGNEKLFGNLTGQTSFFNDTSPNAQVNAKWWDGTPSGLAIYDIKIQPNKTITFKIGKRPARPLFFDFDEAKFNVSLLQIGPDVLVTPKVLIPSEVQLMPPGSVKLSISPKNNAALSYKVVSNQFRSSATYTGPGQVTIINSDFKDNIIKIVSSTPSTVIKNFKVMMDQGARVIFHSPSQGNTVEVESYDYVQSGTTMILSKNCYSGVCEPMALFATPKPGFKITGWSILYNDNTSDSGGDSRIKLNPLKVDQVKLIRARAERTTNLCASNIENWRWDGEYSDLGVLVKDTTNGSIYSSNLPRNNFYERRLAFAFPAWSNSFRPSSTNASVPWKKEEACQGTAQVTQSCLNIPVWTPYTTYSAGAQVVYNNRLWKMGDIWSDDGLIGGVGVMPPLNWKLEAFNANTGITAGLIPPGVHNELWRASTTSVSGIKREMIKVCDNSTSPPKCKFNWVDGEEVNYDLGISSIYPFKAGTNVPLYALPSMWKLQAKCN